MKIAIFEEFDIILYFSCDYLYIHDHNHFYKAAEGKIKSEIANIAVISYNLEMYKVKNIYYEEKVFLLYLALNHKSEWSFFSS